MLLAEKKPISNKKVIWSSLHSKFVLIAGIDINLEKDENKNIYNNFMSQLFIKN